MKNFDQYIIVTGAAGFIGSCMAGFLNEQGYEKLILVDDFGHESKRPNWEGKQYSAIVERYNLHDWLLDNNPYIGFVFHLGARTDTTEFDYAIHQELNVEYSQMLWQYCTEKQIPMVYASSAATYGAGEYGYNDSHDILDKLAPLNPYGVSKNEFDKWALQQIETPPFWAGLKFFNVYGPNEYHKGRMASVIWHAFNQIKKDGLVKLFKSHRPDFEDGQQLRDFIYVKDVVKVMYWLMGEDDGRQTTDDGRELTDDGRQTTDAGNNAPVASGLYNLGTGKARSFYDLAANTFTAQDKFENIQFIDMPIDIRDKYQYFTEANMSKLVSAGYTAPFYSLEEGVEDYVRGYLMTGRYY